MTKNVTIRYCTRCRWMLRAAWIAQELLTTFENELDEVTLMPDHSGGVFTIHVQGQLVFSKVSGSGFPDIKTLKQHIRDHIAPGKSLGHSDVTQKE